MPRASRDDGLRIAIVQALWNREITDVLATGAVAAAEAAGATSERHEVAGTWELAAAVRALGETGRYDAVVPLGCLLRGETAHFQVLADAVAAGLMTLSITLPTVVPFGVLTCNTIDEARARACPERNVGAEAVEAALSVLALRRSSGK